MPDTRGRIQFAGDAIDQVPSNGGGVYALRQKTPSLSSKHSAKDLDEEYDPNEKVSEWDDRDFKKRQNFSGWYLAWLAYQSIGVVYGDIGTSPLYVYSSTFSSNPSYDDLVGALSLIIWTLTLIVTIKYCFIVLRADDEGEGGTFAIFTLLSRYMNLVRRDPREESMVRMERVRTNELKGSSKSTRSFIEHSRILRVLLKLAGVVGVALIMADGVLTPAQSVLGAIQGLKVVHPSISQSTVIGSSCGILVVLFFAQPFGLTKLATTFAPIVIIWLGFNFTFGIYNLVKFDHSVLKAFSPYFAGHYLVRDGNSGWISLGGILLAFTGVETLFADLGSFSRRAIQISWLFFAFPCLLLGYIGQAAYISSDSTGTAYSNPFFNTVPPGMLYPSLVIAILAAIVASQATITATFQLVVQIMKLSYFPQIKVVHKSKIFHGQIYVPIANWLLMIGTVIVTAVYTNTTNLGHAYGVCVVLVTFLTTCMVSVVMLVIWRVPWFVALAFFLVFGALDGVYLTSALTKVPTGAWFTLVLAFLLSCVFLYWRFGKEQQWRAEASDLFPPSRMIMPNQDPSFGPRSLQLTPTFGGSPLTTIRGMGIFFDKAGQASSTPSAFQQFVQKFAAASDVIIFLHLRVLSVPSVPAEERYSISRCLIGPPGKVSAMPNCFRMILRHGYTDVVVTPDLGLLVYDQIRDFVIRESASFATREQVEGKQISAQETAQEKATASSLSSSDAAKQAHAGETDVVASQLADLERAYQAQVVYIVGKEQLRIRRTSNIFRQIFLEPFLWMRENSGTKVQRLNVDVEKLVEVGFVKEM